MMTGLDSFGGVMLYKKNWAQAWLGFGFVWFLAGIALAPSNKLYQQGMILFLWLPTLVLAWSARDIVVQAWRRQPALWGAIALLLAWSAVSLAWSTTGEGGRDAKRLFYIVLFLLAFPLLAQAGLARNWRLLRLAAVLLAVAAVISIAQFYWATPRLLLTRLHGIGEISHPILGAYVVGAAILWLLHDMPRQRGAQLGWALALACLGAFVILTQSRGAIMALIITVVLAPLWFRNRHSCLYAGLAVASTGAAFYVVYDLIMRRGASYRQDIFESSTQMIAEHPWGGLGLGSHYKVEALGRAFDHTHNMFTHVGIELGLIGMLLWVAVWLFALGEILRARGMLFGKVLLGYWIFSTLAMQFDAASLTDTPRAEWFISWLPVGLAMLLPWVRAENDACGKIPGST